MVTDAYRHLANVTQSENGKLCQDERIDTDRSIVGRGHNKEQTIGIFKL